MEWTYCGKNGPEYWSGLCPEFQTAESETPLQSPIPLTTLQAHKVSTENNGFLFAGKKMTFETHYFNHTIHLSPIENQEVAEVYFNKTNYFLDDAHAHLPSEHVIDGNTFELEMHFVFRTQENEVLVMGIMGQSTTSSYRFKLVHRYTHLLQEEELNQRHKIELDLDRFMPEKKSFFHYIGSLTTPPTLGPVQWVVMEHAIAIPSEFIDAFKNAIGKTNRPLQDVQARQITFYE